MADDHTTFRIQKLIRNKDQVMAVEMVLRGTSLEKLAQDRGVGPSAIANIYLSGLRTLKFYYDRLYFEDKESRLIGTIPKWPEGNAEREKMKFQLLALIKTFLPKNEKELAQEEADFRASSEVKLVTDKEKDRQHKIKDARWLIECVLIYERIVEGERAVDIAREQGVEPGIVGSRVQRAMRSLIDFYRADCALNHRKGTILTWPTTAKSREKHKVELLRIITLVLDQQFGILKDLEE